MNVPDIPEIKERYEAATEGPWEASEDIRTHAMVVFQPENGGLVIHDGECLSDADANFIAHARTDIPALVTALEEAQELLQTLSRTEEMMNWGHPNECAALDGSECVCGLDTLRRLGESE